MNITTSRTTMKTIAMKRNILREPADVAWLADLVVDIMVDVCEAGAACTSVGTELCMNDLGGI